MPGYERVLALFLLAFSRNMFIINDGMPG
jgi:hypothetical protein